jgi:hypothetical protein
VSNTGEPTLFDPTPYRVELPEPAKLSRQQLLTISQRERIARGVHPLAHTAGTGRLMLGPAGPTCGDCKHRSPASGPGTYPKCHFGKRERLEPYAGRAITRTVYPRVDSSAATDCRKWWPCCTDFAPRETTSGPKSTLTGWTPAVGDLVWVQMYSPQLPEVDSTIEERIAHGKTYMDRRLMIVMAVHPDHPRVGVTRWSTRKPGPDKGPAYWSGCDSDCCVLEDASSEETGRG